MGRAILCGLPDMRDCGHVDGLLAGLGIDRRHHVLRDGLFVPQPRAVGPVERLDDAKLTCGHDCLAGFAVDRQVDQQSLVDVV